MLLSPTKYMATNTLFIMAYFYNVDPHPDRDLQKKQTPDLYKKRTLYKSSLNGLKTHHKQIQGC